MVKLGDPPYEPTPIDKCNKCGNKPGFHWEYSKSMEAGDGYQTCLGCNARQ